MENSKLIKEKVREKYAQIAEQKKAFSGGCGCGCGSKQRSGSEYTVFSEDYSKLQGYSKDADLGLGCGLPTEHALIKPGDTVVDLGSGAGNDCFVALAETGPGGRVIGVDFTGTMVEKARENARKLNISNIEFHLGEIENIPLPDNTADVVISNCVFNLVPDKEAAFRETFRILKPGGHFSISDIVITGELPEEYVKDAEVYAGCIAGAEKKEKYLKNIVRTGFENIRLVKERSIEIPGSILEKYFDKNSDLGSDYDTGIFSITVCADKPLS